MPALNARCRRRAHALAAALAAAAIGALAATGLLWPSPAHAHFILQAPTCWAAQDIFGMPQKSAPCGQADPGYPIEPSGEATPFHPGDTITVTIKEIIYHPGHYRVLLAPDHDSLPEDPKVVPGATPCGSTTIETNPVLPLLADGLLVHTSAFREPQSVQVKLPASLPCTKCTLQVVQFMSDHGLNDPGGCFYHHCANITITAADGGPEAPPVPAGCSCRVGAGRTSRAVDGAGLLALGLLLRPLRRRRA